MPRRVAAAVTVAGLCLLAWVCATRADDVGAAVAAVPVEGFAAAVGLHLAVLVARSEAWRVALAAVAGPALPRVAVHPVNAGAFLMGSVQSHCALPTRVALLRRLPCAQRLRPTQIGVADAPIFVLEVFCGGVLLAGGIAAGAGAGAGGGGAWWAGPLVLGVAAAALLGTRALFARFAHRPMARGLAVLADVRRRRVLLALVAAITALTAARIWLILDVCGLPHGLAAVASVFAALGAFGLLPLGPAGSPGATLVTVGSSGVGPAVAAGLVVSATSIAAVVVYAVTAVVGARIGPRVDGVHVTVTARRPIVHEPPATGGQSSLERRTKPTRDCRR